MPFRHAAFALIGFALSAGAQAYAQDQTCLVGAQRGTGSVQIATTCALGNTPALSEFRFVFVNGDHRIRAITLMPAGDHYQGQWADSGGEDPHYTEARWLRIPEAQGGVVEAVVQGVADIPIPRGPANTTLVLSGFEFRRADGSDANVRSLSIQTDSASSTIRTVLVDDQGANFEELALAIGLGFAFGAAGAPDPNMSMGATVITQVFQNYRGNRLRPGVAEHTFLPPENNPTLTASTTASGEIQVSDTNARPYAVRVAYLWVPNNRLARSRSVSGTRRDRVGVSGELPGETPIVLRGFAFSFGNSDHYLESFGVHLSGGGPVQTRLSHNEIVSWQDGDRDDPMQWAVQFSELVGSPPAAFNIAPTRIIAPTTGLILRPAGSATPAPEASSTPAPEEDTPPAPRRRGERREE